jgi:peptidoglycan-N-acetylglucosamine deacetylase
MKKFVLFFKITLLLFALGNVNFVSGQNPDLQNPGVQDAIPHNSKTVKPTAATSASAKKAIICLTYDDGLASQLSTVIPQLDAAGFRGTFFLNSIQGASEKIGESSPAITGWTNAALTGHELANHTLFHACPEQLGWAKHLSIGTYTINKIRSEIRTQNSILALLDPKRKLRSYAYPCNNFMIGNTDYSKLIKAERLVSYGRVGGDRTSVVNDFSHLDLMKVPSWMVEEGTSGDDLIAFAEKVKAGSGLGIYQFHAIDGQLFSVSAEAHQALLKYLKNHEADFLVTTFSEAMDLIVKSK